ncbi:MAG: hypothetical protein U0457_21155 [Candidatus Sericytochromatia bacterium]
MCFKVDTSSLFFDPKLFKIDEPKLKLDIPLDITPPEKTKKIGDSIIIDKKLSEKPKSTPNIDFVQTTDKKGVDNQKVKVGSGSNNFEVNLSTNNQTEQTKFNNVKVSLIDDESPLKISGGISNDPLDKTPSKPTAKTTSTKTTKLPTINKQSTEDTKTTGNIKAELKASDSLTITTEGQIDSEKASKIGTGAKLKVTKDINAETQVKYESGKTKAALKSDAKVTSNVKLIAEAEHEISDINNLKKGNTSAGIKAEYSPLKNVTITAGSKIDQKGKVFENLRGETKLGSLKFSTGIETEGLTFKNKYDAKVSGEVFKGLTFDTGIEYKDNKTAFKVGGSYSLNDNLKVEADTTGREHSFKIRGGFKLN